MRDRRWRRIRDRTTDRWAYRRAAPGAPRDPGPDDAAASSGPGERSPTAAAQRWGACPQSLRTSSDASSATAAPAAAPYAMAFQGFSCTYESVARAAAVAAPRTRVLASASLTLAWFTVRNTR